MTKAELVAKIASEVGLTKSQAEKAVAGICFGGFRRFVSRRQDYAGGFWDFQRRNKV